MRMWGKMRKEGENEDEVWVSMWTGRRRGRKRTSAKGRQGAEFLRGGQDGEVEVGERAGNELTPRPADTVGAIEGEKEGIEGELRERDGREERGREGGRVWRKVEVKEGKD